MTESTSPAPHIPLYDADLEDVESPERAEVLRAAQRLNHLLDLIEPHIPAVIEHVENLGPMLEGMKNNPALRMLGFGR